MKNRDRDAVVIFFFIGMVTGIIIAFTLMLSTRTVLGDISWECTQAVIEDGAPECIKYELKGD